MKRPILTSAGEVIPTRHALERYVERVKPAYTVAHAHYELAQLLPQADRLAAMPGWAEHRSQDNAEVYETDAFLVLCDSILFPVFDGYVMTTLVRGAMGPVVREARSRARRSRHGRHRAQKLSERSGVRRRARKSEGRSGDDWRQAA